MKTSSVTPPLPRAAVELIPGRRLLALLVAASCLMAACSVNRTAVVPLSGGGGSPSMPQKGFVNVEAWPGEVNFGRIEVEGSARQEVAVTNRGDRPVWIIDSQVTGEGFLELRDECSGRAIPPDGSCRVTVAFTPHRPGVFSGALRLRFDDPAYREMEIPLSGRGMAERSPAIEVIPDRLLFGTVELGQFKVIEADVRNLGDADLRFQEVTVGGRGFSKQSDLCSGRFFSPGRSCAVRIAFSPPDEGTFRGSLRFMSNDPRQGTYEVPLEGRGRGRTTVPPPPPGSEGPSSSAEIKAEPERIDFGRVPSGAVKTAEVWVRSRGRADLVISRATVRGEGFVETQDGCSGRTLSPDRSCRMAVSFAPRSGGGFSGVLVVASNAPGGDLAVGLEGTGAMPEPEERCRPVTVGQFQGEGSSSGGSSGEPPPRAWIDEGTLKVGDCVSYTLTIDRPGTLSVCVPPGYSFAGPEFKFLKGVECTIPGDEVRYRQYQRGNLQAGAVLKELIVTRGEKGPRAYRVLFRLRKR